MALAEVCGINSILNLNKNRENDEIDGYNNISNFIDNTELAVPPYPHPAHQLGTFAKSCDEHGNKIQIHFDHGTTTLAFKYQGGILVAVDSRATGGSYIGSQCMKKIVEINKFMISTIAGGAADCVYWDRVLSKQCRMFELRNREPISVAAASKLLSNMVYGYKGMGISIGMMFAGYDKRGASLYYIDSEGTRTSGQLFSVGSGSLYAYGVMDSGYRWDLTDEEAYELGRRSIYHATHRDGASGGLIRVYHVKETGWVDISVEDCKDLHYKYQEEKKVQA